MNSKTIKNCMTALLLLLSTSCGGRQPKTAANNNDSPKVETVEVVQQQQEETETEADKQAFSQLMLEIFYQLPASVMRDNMKTEKQRKEKTSAEREEGKDYIRIGTVDCNNYNCLYYTEYGGEGSYGQWKMTGYLTEDQMNVVVIVQDYSCYEGCSLISDNTLNYNIETKKCVAMTRPIELPTIDEMVFENLYKSKQLYQKAKVYFNKKMTFFYDFNSEGFNVILDNSDFRQDNWEDYDLAFPGFIKAYYKWNGKQFVKDRFEVVSG